MAFQNSQEAAIHGQIEETTAWKDFLALIKWASSIPISLRHLLNVACFYFTGMSFLGNLDIVLLTMIFFSLLLPVHARLIMRLTVILIY